MTALHSFMILSRRSATTCEVQLFEASPKALQRNRFGHERNLRAQNMGSPLRKRASNVIEIAFNAREWTKFALSLHHSLRKGMHNDFIQ